MPRRLALLLALFVAVPVLNAAPPVEKINPEDVKLLKANNIDPDGPALLDYFRKRTITAKERGQMDALIQLLGNDAFKVREKANADLLALGASALPQLRRAVDDPDEEIRTRAREGIAAIEAKTKGPLTIAVVRVLRVKAPVETVKTLLDFVPDAENDAVSEEVLYTLAVLGVKENKVNALIVEALKDKLAARRAAAALVVGRSGTAEQRKSVQALLADTDPRVRFRAAQGLLAARERMVIPTFIALLTDAPPELAGRAEELLSSIAGGRGLHMPVSDNMQQNRVVRAAWEQWWKQNARIDLSHADVDLPPFNASLRARETARQFAVAAFTSDKDKLDKLVALPFFPLGEQTLTTRAQVNQYMINYMQNLTNRGLPVNPVCVATMTVDEYLKTLQPRQQQQLAALRKADVRVVVMQWPSQIANRLGELGDSVIFVRVAGEQPQVLGVNLGGNGLVPSGIR